MGTLTQTTEALPPRHAALVRVTHGLITLSFLALLVTGVEILISHPRFYWGETGNVNTPTLFKIPIPSSRGAVPTGYGYVLPDQNGWSRYLHFEAAWVAVLTGLLYVAFGFFGGHFQRNLLPSPSDLSPNRLAIDIARHLRFQRPSEEEAWSYNVLQRLTYLLVIFVVFPLVIWTGLAMSPAIAGVFPGAVTVLGGRQSARTLHFFVSILLVLFLLIHIFMVFLAGFRKRVGAMITGRLAQPGGANMSTISRRKLMTTGLLAAAGATGLGVAAKLAGRYGLIPPDAGVLYGAGETLTYAAQRLLTRHSRAQEFSRSQISEKPFANPVDALGAEFQRLQQGGFAEWRLAIDGMVAKPGSFSLAEIKSFPRSSQITLIACEEGWSYIAEWSGVPLAHVLDLVGALPQARYVVYRSFQPDWWESIDMADALHPQTIMALGMNGGELPVPFGGPLRLRVPRQLGYKNVKYITRLTVTDSLKHFGKGLGSASPEGGYSWYAGI